MREACPVILATGLVEAALSKAMNNGVSPHEALPYTARDLAVQDFAPRSEWSEMCESDHFVQFYETDAFLINSVGGFVQAGLDNAEACLVVATEAHRAGLENFLRARGIEVDAALAAGQFVSLDAADT